MPYAREFRRFVRRAAATRLQGASSVAPWPFRAPRRHPSRYNLRAFTIGKAMAGIRLVTTLPNDNEVVMQLLSRLKIRTKLAGIVVLAALTAFGIVAVSASLSRDLMIEDRVAKM